MGTITQRQNKRSAEPIWQATIRIKGQKAISRSFDSRPEADAFITKIEPQLRSQAKSEERKLTFARQKNPSLADYLEESLSKTLSSYVASPKCSGRDKRVWPVVERSVGSAKIRELDAHWVDAYLATMRATQTHQKTTYSYATLDGHMGLISRACRWRGKQLKVTPHVLPFSKKDNFPDHWENKRTRRLSKTEEKWIRDHFCGWDHPAREHWLLLLDLALETGARLQELVLATDAEFDVEHRVWSMPAPHTKMKTARFVVLTMKAQAAARRLLELAKPGEPRVFHPIINTHAATGKFCRTVRKLGIVNLRFHDLRHEAISRMVSDHREVRVIEIMQMVGHRSAEMLHRYAHGRADEIALRMK